MEEVNDDLLLYACIMALFDMTTYNTSRYLFSLSSCQLNLIKTVKIVIPVKPRAIVMMEQMNLNK